MLESNDGTVVKQAKTKNTEKSRKQIRNKYTHPTTSTMLFLHNLLSCRDICLVSMLLVVTLLENLSAFFLCLVFCSGMVWSVLHWNRITVRFYFFFSFCFFLVNQSARPQNCLLVRKPNARCFSFFPPCPFVCIVTLSSGFVRCCVVKFIQAS